MKQVAILQSNYIPWKGYFDLIAAVDEFILYDDMQYTKNDWRNRNRIKTPNGLEWLTIPAGQDISRRIRDVELAPGNWQAKHWKSLTANYAKAPYFNDIAQWLRPLYLDQQHHNLSQLNQLLLQAVCDYLGITTRITRSWDYALGEGKTERLVDLCLQAGGQDQKEDCENAGDFTHTHPPKSSWHPASGARRARRTDRKPWSGDVPPSSVALGIRAVRQL